MRIRNGADWLELAIRTHIDFFDEIVAVYNQCTDETAEILWELQREFGPDKLRVIHYLDRVFPPGSADHARTSATSPNSLVNYCNFALASTRYQYATKLDDDHLAIADATESLATALRGGDGAPKTMYCFSGLNLFRRPDGVLEIFKSVPISGGGDIGFFRVTHDTFFSHDRRFERFHRGRVRRTFAGFLYWHLKFLKRDMGFGNYELSQNPHSRYARGQASLSACMAPTIALDELVAKNAQNLLRRARSLFVEKWALHAARDRAVAGTFPDASVEEAIRRTVQGRFHEPFFSHLVDARPDQVDGSLG